MMLMLAGSFSGGCRFVVLVVVMLGMVMGIAVERPAPDELYVLDRDGSPAPQPVPIDVYEKLPTYAHLIDIAYCVSNINRIGKPFECGLDCSGSFPNMRLVYQWFFDDSVCGYIATTNCGLFGEQEPSERRTIVVSLRGTKSVFDTLADMRVNMVEYSNSNVRLPPCEGCRIHKGFDEYFHNTLTNMHSVLEEELRNGSYELVFLGHSLGGSISLLLALHYMELGYENITLVTMGQPLVGNKNFVEWADQALGSLSSINFTGTDRRFLRVIHRDDIVATLPVSDRLVTRYHQFDNQIYINSSDSSTSPLRSEVLDCVYGDNVNCIQRDFSNIISVKQKNYFEIHNTYFRRMGLCGVGLRDGIVFGYED